jgi:hypothetical protein
LVVFNPKGKRYENNTYKTSPEKINGASWIFPVVGIGQAADCLLLHI